MENKKQLVMSDATKDVLKKAIEEAIAEREIKRTKDAKDFHDMLNRQHEAQHIKDLGVLHEALQENMHLAPKSWGKSIVLVAADIIREYGKEQLKLTDKKVNGGIEMMIGGKRGCGKTTEIIKKSHQEHLYIICADQHRVRLITDMARDLGLDIPFPITVSELPLRGYRMDAVLVDDVEDVLRALIQKRVVMASTSMELREL